MTRQEYMQQLAALLAAMPEAERRDALDYYEEYFDAAGPEKEAQTIQELGSPRNVAEKIWEGTGAQFGTPMPDNSMPEQGSRRRKSPVWIVPLQRAQRQRRFPRRKPRGKLMGKPPGEQPKIWTKARMKIPKQPSQRKAQKAKAPTGWKVAR